MMRLHVVIALALAGCTYSPMALESPCVPRSGRAVLDISPERIRDYWLPPGEAPAFMVSVRRSDCLGPRVEVVSHPDWVAVSVGDRIGADVVAVELVVDVMAAADVRRGTVVLHDRRDGRIRGEVELDLRAIVLEEVHVGPADESCPRVGGSACDFVGRSALSDAAAAHADGGLRIFVHDDDGMPAFYDRVVLPADTWMSAAPGLSENDVVVECQSAGDGAVALAGDNIRLQRVTLLADDYCSGPFWVWDSGGHLIENIIGASVSAEHFGSNGLQEVIVAGHDTTVRNSFFWGYNEGAVRLEGTRRARVVGNTIVTFQNADGAPDLRDLAFVWAQQSVDALVANNVFVVMSVRAPVLVRAEDAAGLRIIGNAAEGVDAVVAGLDGLDGRSEVRDNRLAETLDLLSPIEPRFLADSDQISAAGLGFEGVSLDGVESAAWSVPGAFQRRAEVSLPRPDVVRIGPEPGRCGGEACDTWQEMTHEVQWGLWRAWPGARVEIYPAEQPYAGSVVVSWPVTVTGMGSQPGDVVLLAIGHDVDDDLLLDRLGHDAGLTIHRSVHAGPVVVENLTVRVDHHMPNFGVLVEPQAWPGAFHHTHVLRRLRVDSGDGVTSHAGFGLGGRVLLRDSLVVGEFGACATLGPRDHSGEPTLATTNWILNLTCRLRGANPVAAFEVGGVYDSLIINVAAETETPAPVFSAPRRDMDDDDVFARDAPFGFEAHASTYVNFSDEVYDFDASRSGFDIVVEMLPTATLFASDDDHHLVDHGIDAGRDPADYGFAAGVSLDGVPRQGSSIDQGCYEQ